MATGLLLPGGTEGVPRLRAYTVPAATPTAASAPTLIRIERVRCCRAGAIATPVGLAAAPPAVDTFSAVAAPCGSAGCAFGCGAAGRELVWAGCDCWSAPA